MKLYSVERGYEGTTFSLSEILSSDNLAEEIGEDQLGDIGRMVVEDHRLDTESRSEWLDRNADAIDLAMQMRKNKTWPWPNASNVKFPLLTIGAIQFHSRVYPNVVSESPVRCKVFGKDEGGQKAARASRVSQHMSYQLLEEDEEWEENFDALLLSLPITGCEFTKLYYDPVKGYPCSRWVSCRDLVVPYYAESLRDAPRVTHEMQRSPRRIEERVRTGLWRDVDLGPALQQPPDEGGKRGRSDERTGMNAPSNDPDATRMILEQHRYLDLDGDGYTEPYIVTVDRDTVEVLRIQARFAASGVKTDGDELLRGALQEAEQRMQELARAGHIETMRAEADKIAAVMTSARDGAKVLSIQPVDHFTRYQFLPSIDGGIYGRGFGALTGPLNESVNTIINQLVDAGTLANMQGGFKARGAKLGKAGSLYFRPGEWKEVNCTGDDLRKNLVPMKANAPSPVLFNLLGLLIDYTERVTSITDLMVGQTPGQNTPATTSMSALEQGMSVFTGIFKRVLRSLKQDFRKLYRLNREHLDPSQYVELLGGDAAMLVMDYKGSEKHIRPAADPNMVTDQQKMVRAQNLAARAQTVPGYDSYQVEKRVLESFGIEDTEQVFPTEEGTRIPPPQDAEIEIKKAEHERRTLEAQGREELGWAKQKLDEKQAEVSMLLDEARALEIAQNMDLEPAKLVLEEMKVKKEENAKDGQSGRKNTSSTSGSS